MVSLRLSKIKQHTNAVNAAMVICAVLLSTYDGLLNQLAGQGGSSSVAFQYSIQITLALPLTALACFKFPNFGALAYWSILALSVLLFVVPGNRHSVTHSLVSYINLYSYASGAAGILILNAILQNLLRRSDNEDT